jgi:hypothetical protein
MRFSTLFFLLFFLIPIKQPPLNAIIAPIDTSLAFKANTNTSFLYKKNEIDKKTKQKRIFRIVLLAASSILLIYFLQSTIWLAIIPAAIFSFFKIRNKMRSRPTREYAEYDPHAYHESHARKSVRRFVYGLISTLISIVSLIFGVISESSFFAFPFLGTYVLGVIFFIMAIIAVIKSNTLKEPFKSTTTLILVLSFLFLLPFLITPLGVIFGA